MAGVHPHWVGACANRSGRYPRYSPLDLWDYPWSHSLVMTVVWATAFALMYYFISRYRTGAVVIWFGVVSHWVLDWISHRADMPLYPGGPRVGLGLWNSVTGTMTVEIGLFVIGVWLYLRTTCARDRVGRYALAAYVGLLLLLYVSDRFSPPPPSVDAIASVGLTMGAVFIPWAWWFDLHREGLRQRLGS